MKTAVKITLIMMIGFALTVTSGWAEEKMSPSGFLSDYSKLTQDDPLKFVDWYYSKEGLNLGSYNKIMLEHVAFFLSEDSAYKGIQADEMNELAEAVHQAAIKELSADYTFTDEPGPGVMILRFAFTNLTANKPVVGTVTTIIPVGLVLSAGKKTVTGTHMGMGGSSFEAELVDSQTKEVLMAAIDTKTGKKYKILKSASKWGQTKEVLEMWAIDFAKRLDSASGRK